MMAKTSLLVLAALIVVPTAASAQRGGYYSQPPPTQLPGGFHDRQGRIIFGFDLGLGTMSDQGGDIECANCDYSPISMGLFGHVGGFLTPRFALMAEAGASAMTISSDYREGTSNLVQSVLMVAGQYWITPQLWIKGGIGFANLQVETSYYSDGVVDEVTIPENGGAIMGAVGYELLSARNFSVDLQGRLVNGSYKGIDNNITAASIGVGINWF